MINKLTYFFIDNYYALIVICGLTNMLGIPSFEGGLIKLSTLIAIIFVSRISFKPIDIIVVFFIFHCLLSYFWGEVLLDIYIDGIDKQILPISFYFIAREFVFNKKILLNKMKWPLLFAFISALLLFFFMPHWYVEYKTQQWDLDYQGQSYYERMRLSGFWAWPYFLGNASLFYLMYEILNKRSNKFYFPSIVIALLVLFLSQMRVAIAFFLLFLILTIVFSNRIGLKNLNLIKRIVLLIMFGGFIFAIFFFYIIDDNYLVYIFDRSLGSNSNFVFDRVNYYSKYVTTISFLGTGLGGFSHNSYHLGLHSITDCDYLRIPNEIGVFGFFVLLCIIFIILFMGIKKVRDNYFEVCILLFLLVDMIGAAPLELRLLQPFMFWFCMGRIVNNSFIQESHIDKLNQLCNYLKLNNRKHL